MDFYISEAARLAGFNGPLMINHLERTEVFSRQLNTEKHHGKRRRYTFRDIVVLRAINRLLKLGARPKRIVEAIRYFEKMAEIPSDIDSLLAFSNKSSLFIVSEKT